MFTDEKKKNTNYGSIFVYCIFCFVFIVEVARFTKPYYNFENLAKAEAVVEEGLLNVENSGILPCPFVKSRSKNHQELSQALTPLRVQPPSTYCVKFKSFETMMKQVKNGKYESRPFSVGGYNWTLVIYPNGLKPEASDGYVSVYARIDNSTLITNPRDVYAEIKLFVYNRPEDKYYTYQETDAQRFHLFKQQWGVPNFRPTSYITNEAYGYSFDGGQVAFGVDIFVTPVFDKWEVFSSQENIRDPILNWKLLNFSTGYSDSYTSGSFSSGGKDWLLKVYPNGVGPGTGNSLSFYLLSASNEQVYVDAKLRVIDQVGSNNVEKRVGGWPNATENGWGFDKFMNLTDIRNASKGFLVNDALKLEVEMLSFSKTEYF